jgi:hypothetical protein
MTEGIELETCIVHIYDPRFSRQMIKSKTGRFILLILKTIQNWWMIKFQLKIWASGCHHQFLMIRFFSSFISPAGRGTGADKRSSQ